MTRPIVLCIGEDPTSTYVYQAIRHLEVTYVIKEDGPVEVRPGSTKEWLRQLGVRFTSPLLRRFSRQRVRELQARYPLNDSPIPSHHLSRVTSLNDARTMMWFDRLQPQLVILHETGPVEMSRLERLDCPILTVSPSIAKGQLEAYWAFRAKPNVCEVRIEQSGNRGWTVLDRSVLYVGGTDNFATYPYLQLVTALPLLCRQIESMLEEDVYDRRAAK